MQERWLPVVGFPHYDVSDLGRVRSWKLSGSASRHGGRSASPRELVRTVRKRDGYLTVGLWLRGRKTTLKMHGLVLTAFVGPRPESMGTRHLNGVRADNRLNNLCWGNALDQIADQRRHGTRKLTARDLTAIHTMLDCGYPQGDVAIKFDIHRSTVSRIRSRARGSA